MKVKRLHKMDQTMPALPIRRPPDDLDAVLADLAPVIPVRRLFSRRPA